MKHAAVHGNPGDTGEVHPPSEDRKLRLRYRRSVMLPVKMNAPTFIYGTAWKKEATTALVRTAVTAGFKAIDTANQPRHYSEPLVGDALAALANQGVSR